MKLLFFVSGSRWKQPTHLPVEGRAGQINYDVPRDRTETSVLLYVCETSGACLVQSYSTLCDPMDCSPLGSSVHGILQARTLEWVAMSFSRGSSWPRDQTHVSCTASRVFTTEPSWEPQDIIWPSKKRGVGISRGSSG